MRNDGSSYEDELDRMRARQQRRTAARQKQGGREQETPPRHTSQGWDDTIIYRKPGAYDPYLEDDDSEFENLNIDGSGTEEDDDFQSLNVDLLPNRKTSANSVNRNASSRETASAGKTSAGRNSSREYASSAREYTSGSRRSSQRPSSNQRAPQYESQRANTTGGQAGNRPRPRKKKRGGILWKAALLAVVILVGSWFFRQLGQDEYWTIAVFGVDSRDGNTGKGALSDVEMLCSINKKTGEIRLVSVFRDSYLRIDEDGDYDKINEAYFKGGHEQAVNALKANLDLEIDDYATFNWKAVVDAINVLGGVDIEITDREFAYINSFITETVNSTGVGSYQLEHSGMNHLDGVQAVAYARLRLMDTDFNRTERQRKVLGLAMEKAKKANAGTLTTLVGTVYPQVSTSIGVDDLISVAKNARKYYISQTSGFPFSHQEIKIKKKSCVVPTTLESNVIQLHSFLYDTDQYTPSDTVKAISSHIIEVSGLGEPGKDTESGKNVGAEGNSGGGQSSPKQESKAPETTSSAETTPETSETAESESETESTEETEETIEALESEASSERTENSESSIIDGTGNSNSEKGPGASRPSDQVSDEPKENETTAVLEAPGQGNNQLEEEEQGSGV